MMKILALLSLKVIEIFKCGKRVFTMFPFGMFEFQYTNHSVFYNPDGGVHVPC